MGDQREYFCDVLIIGGGPAGIAAAVRASEHGQRVIIVDDNSAPGGQIWRGGSATMPDAAKWIEQLKQIQFIGSARVFQGDGVEQVSAETADAVCVIHYQKLILATGARERFVPFPGWTLPGVMGAGGLQAMVKGGMPIRGKRVILAGTGPLLMAVAAYLREKGAEIALIAEQTPLHRVARFAAGLIFQPAKLGQLLDLQQPLLGVPYLTSCWPTAAQGDGALRSVTLRQRNRSWQVECDYLACSYYLMPNLELPMLLGCAVQGGVVQVNQFQETSQPNIYAVGEITGIGGVEKSLAEGQIAGYAAAGAVDSAHKQFAERARQHRFARGLARTFALRPELGSLAQPDTIICRCEDVTRQQLDGYPSWSAAKLHTRCGMGPCQGRICGPTVSLLYGWQVESVRPPLFPVSLEALSQHLQFLQEKK